MSISMIMSMARGSLTSIISNLLVAILSVFSFLSVNTIPMTVELIGTDVPDTIAFVVDEEKLSDNYQSGRWDGSVLIGFGHIAKVENGELVVDGCASYYPADSSVANNSISIYSDENGTWFKDETRNEVRYGKMGRNLFTFNVEYPGIWNCCTDGKDMYIANNDGDIINIINMTTYEIA